MKKHLVSTLVLCGLLSATPVQACNSSIPETTPSSRFQDLGDGTVLDTKTGLTWMRCSVGQSWAGASCTGAALKMNWAQALQLANHTHFADASNWRLPNIKELASIVEESCSYPSINSAVFPNTSGANFWSSTNGGCIDFGVGADYECTKSGALSVRLVREAP